MERAVGGLGTAFRATWSCGAGGPADFGNVCRVVPGVIVFVPYVQVPGHSPEWVEAGTSDIAATCLMNSAKVLTGMAYDLLMEPELIAQAKEEFAKMP